MNTSIYTGGAKGWGTLLCRCPYCRADVEEWNVDEDGIPTSLIWSDDAHECPEDEE